MPAQIFVQGGVRVTPKTPVALEPTLYSGQAFRWTRRADGSHAGIVGRDVWSVRATGAGLNVAGKDVRRAHVSRYFRLDGSHEDFLKHAGDDPALIEALRTFSGMRVLRQDPWEMLVSFLISQNSNEAKIRDSIERLCRLAGEPLPHDPGSFAFPRPDALADLGEAQLRTTKIGYRAGYVLAAARAVDQGHLRPDELPLMGYEDAFARLMQIDGVGPKVADCVLLYGCGHLSAFPGDVWVRRFLRETYLRRRRNPSQSQIREFALRRFGPYAGYAQHYLFHYRRTVGALSSSKAV